MIIKKQGCKMDVHLEQTKKYYISNSICDCPSCRNYYAQVKDKFHLLDEFLLELGVSIDRPDEMGCIELDNEIQYVFASYTVCGKILELDKYEIDINDGGLFLNIVIGDSYVPNEQKTDYFVVTVYHIVLPWVLDEPFPEPASKGKGDVKNKNKMIYNSSSKYSEHHCVLVKKYRTLFHYIWVLEENGKKFKIHIGKAMYISTEIGSQLTIGRIGRKLINLRKGVCKLDK